MADFQTFTQFLNQSYRKILQACLEDEAIQTLRILQSKDYLLLRINELFSEIYNAERQNKINSLIDTVNSLQKGQSFSQVNKEEKCRSCQNFRNEIQELQRQNRLLSRKNGEMLAEEEKETKKNQSLLLNQNQNYRKKVKELQTQLTENVKTLNEEKQVLQNELKKLKQLIKDKEKNYLNINESMKEQIKIIKQQNKKLEKQVMDQIQVRGNQQKLIRQVNAKMSNANVCKQRLQNELNFIRNEYKMLEEKIVRLEEEGEFLKQRTRGLEKENKNLKKANQSLASQMYARPVKNESNQNKENEEFASSMSKVQQIQKINIQLQKRYTQTKVQLEKKCHELNENILYLQKTNIILGEDLKKSKIKFEKELRDQKEQSKNRLEQVKEESLQTKQKQIEVLNKKFNALLAQKARVTDKLTQQNKELNRIILKNQQNLEDLNAEHEQELKRLINQSHKQRQVSKDIKSHLQNEKSSQLLFQRQWDQKYNDLLKEKKQLIKVIDLKQKEIKNLLKQLTKSSEQQMSKDLLVSSLKDKCSQYQKSFEQDISQLKMLKQTLRSKQKFLKEFKRKYEQTQQQKDELQKKVSHLIQSQTIYEQKLKRMSQDLIEKREIILQMQKNSQSQVIDIYQQTQNHVSQTKKQIESYYHKLLKNQQEKKIQAQMVTVSKVKEQEIEELQSASEELNQKMMKYKSRYLQQVKQREMQQGKVANLLEQIDTLKKQNSKLMELIRHEKSNNTNLIKGYQQKMMEYYNNFGQFKRQLYIALKQQLRKLKSDLGGMKIILITQLQKIKEWMAAYCFKLTQQMEMLSTNYQLKCERIRHQYENGKVLKLEDEKRQIQVSYEMKLKEKSMQFFTIIAEKQHQIASLIQKQTKICHKIVEEKEKGDQMQRIARESTKKQQQLKQVVNKMNSKVNEAERTSSILKNQLQYIKRQNIELKKQMNSLQMSFKQKLQKCRETYAVENERLFNKYQKQFGKFIISNKKGLEYSMISSNSCSNMHIPTKGNQNDDKLEKIQKEILEQKKKLNILEQGAEVKSKFDKTCKIVNMKDVPKNEKSKKY